MSHRDSIFHLSIDYISSKYQDWKKSYYEDLNLFEILDYGNLETIHTKFLYWMLDPSYHRKTYKDNYAREFLLRNKLDCSSKAKIKVLYEEPSISELDAEESRRRSDLWIVVKDGDAEKNIIVENKLFSELTEVQAREEINQYLKNPGDIYIALLFDFHKQQYYSLINRSDTIKKYIKNGTVINLFLYSEWLQLNKEAEDKRYFNRKEQDKIIHLNENLEKLINMEKIKEFDENFKIYLGNYPAIEHFEKSFQKQSRQFFDQVKERILQETKATNMRIRQKNQGLKFDIGKFELELEFEPQYLKDNIIWLGVAPIKELTNKELYNDALKNISMCDTEMGSSKRIWYKILINPYNIDEMEKLFLEKIKQIQSVLIKKL